MDKVISQSLEFHHKLYGKARLVANTLFKVLEHPETICYVLEGDDKVRVSGIWDAGAEHFTRDTLKKLGY